MRNTARSIGRAIAAVCGFFAVYAVAYGGLLAVLWVFSSGMSLSVVQQMIASYVAFGIAIGVAVYDVRRAKRKQRDRDAGGADA